jgi:phosphate acetyltransferase
MATSTSKAEPATGEFSHLDAMMEAARGKKPRAVAVVQAVTAYALGAALDAAREGFVRLLLVGDEKRTRELAASSNLNLEDAGLVDAPKDADAAAEAVALVRSGEAELLMKGHIHTDDFLRPLLDREKGLRTGRTMSHAFVCYLPKHVYPKALLLTDGAFNIAPDLTAKRAILENAVTLAHAIGVAEPKVAVLAATEEVNPVMPATTDARALRDLNRAGEIKGALVDGPFGFDNAISLEAARTKGIESPVCGDPDMLLVPDIECGNMLYKEMVYFCSAITPGVVLGAAVPVILTSRADPPRARLASCALGLHLLAP